MAKARRLTTPGGGDDGILIAPAGTDRDDVTGLFDTGVNLGDTKSALRPTADALYDVSTVMRDIRPNVVTINSDASGADTFNLSFYIRGDASSPYTTSELNDDVSEADLQTAVRAALPGTDLTVATGSGPDFTLAFDPAHYSGPFPRVQFNGTGCTATVSWADNSAASDAQIGALGESDKVSASDTILKPTIGTITVNPGVDAVQSFTYSAGTDGGTVSFGYRGMPTGDLAFGQNLAAFQAALDTLMDADAPTVALYAGGEVQTLDLADVAEADTFKIATGAVGTAKTASIVVPAIVTGAALATLIQTRLNTVYGANSVSVAATDGNTYVVTFNTPGGKVLMQVTDAVGFTAKADASYVDGFIVTTAGSGDAVWRFTFETAALAGRVVPVGRMYVANDLLTDGGVAEPGVLAEVTAGVLGDISAAYTENGTGDSILAAAIADTGGKSYGFAGDAASPVAIAGIPPGAYHLVARTVEDGRVSKADSKAFTMTSA